MDKGYDVPRVYEEAEALNCRPIIPLREDDAVKRGQHQPPLCPHGEWVFAGAEKGRKTTKWRCPTGECRPSSLRRKADRLWPLVRRGTKRWDELYAGRNMVEGLFGQLKLYRGLHRPPLRGLARMGLFVDLMMLGHLSVLLSDNRAGPADS
jgi:hypothetical protein